MKKYILLTTILLIISACSQHKYPSNPSMQTNVDKAAIHQMLDAWHHAAAIADEDAFYNAFTQDGIYIGTDPSEHWTAQELKTLFKKAFEKESAWAFVPHNRHIYQSKDGKTLWFDELLDTWMGPCRGSGVLQLENGAWKIAHYHLSVAIANDDIQPYLEILKAEE